MISRPIQQWLPGTSRKVLATADPASGFVPKERSVAADARSGDAPGRRFAGKLRPVAGGLRSFRENRRSFFSKLSAFEKCCAVFPKRSAALPHSCAAVPRTGAAFQWTSAVFRQNGADLPETGTALFAQIPAFSHEFRRFRPVFTPFGVFFGPESGIPAKSKANTNQNQWPSLSPGIRPVSSGTKRA